MANPWTTLSQKITIQENCKTLMGFNMLEPNINKFNQHQLQLYNHLAGDLLINYLWSRLNIKNNDELYNWDELTWHNTIVRSVESLPNFPINLKEDCWFTNITLGSDNYPTFKITPLIIERRGNQGTRLFQRTGAKNHLVKLYKVFYVLQHPEEIEAFQQRDHLTQTAHRCKNSPQICWNCYHTVTKNDKENKEMNKCWNGCAAYCPHDPKCIFTDQNGYWIPCRNLNTISICTHQVNCHTTSISF